MDDPTPISFDTDGTLYKRAVRLPNGDWAPTTCCDCGPGGVPCAAVRAGTCWDIQISGVELNTNYHDLQLLGQTNGQDGAVNCGAFFSSNFGTTAFNVVAASGINKTFSARLGGNDSAPAQSFFNPHYIVYKIPIGFPPYEAVRVIDIDTAVVRADVECGNRLNLVLDQNPHWGVEPFDPDKAYVSRVFDGSVSSGEPGPFTPFYFNAFNPRLQSRPYLVGESIPNDSECIDYPSGPSVKRGFTNGFAIVTPQDIGVQQECPTEPTIGVAARCGNPLITIPVDVETRTGDFFNCYYNGELYTITMESTVDDPVDVEWTADECPTQPDEWPVAIECGGQGSITFDPATRPPDGVTIQVGDTIYVPTVEVSQDQPTAGAWLPDPCPDGNDIYRINFCRSSQAANQTFSFDPDTNGLRSQTVGYRPGNGLQPGEGHVLIRLPGAAGCLTQVAATPTDIPLSTEPEVILVSRPGTCRGIPSVVVDPRGECQPTDGGGGGIIPDSPNLTALSDLTDTDISAFQLGNLVEQALKTISLNKLETCPACQRRKEVLNRYGDRVGKAILRVLNW